jgi:hypothetical protein
MIAADSQQRSREQGELMPGDCGERLKKEKRMVISAPSRQREGFVSTVSARCGIAKNVLALG